MCFNPSSLDCTSERIQESYSQGGQNKFQSFFSGLYFWKRHRPGPRPVHVGFQSFFSGLYFWKRCGRSWPKLLAVVSILLLWIVLLKERTPSRKRSETGVSILLLWIVLLKESSLSRFSRAASSFNPSSLDCTSESALRSEDVLDRDGFQSFFSGLYFWKTSLSAFSESTRRVSILLLWIVLLKASCFSSMLTKYMRFNPSSLDCTSESVDYLRYPCWGHEFQSFFSGLYFWKPKNPWTTGNCIICFNPSSLDCTSESGGGTDPPSVGFGFNPSSLDCTSERLRVQLELEQIDYVSILLLWIVLLKAALISFLIQSKLGFNPSSLDCTSESVSSSGSSVPPGRSFNPSSLDCTSESVLAQW